MRWSTNWRRLSRRKFLNSRSWTSYVAGCLSSLLLTPTSIHNVQWGSSARCVTSATSGSRRSSAVWPPLPAAFRVGWRRNEYLISLYASFLQYINDRIDSIFAQFSQAFERRSAQVFTGSHPQCSRANVSARVWFYWIGQAVWESSSYLFTANAHL